MLRLLYTSFTFAILGVISGVYYREFTKAHDLFDRSATQLPLVHAHFLVLGFVTLLAIMALERLLRMSDVAPRLNTWFYWLWTTGVSITGAMMIVKGTMAVRGLDVSSPALSGIAGLGHTILTAGVIVLFVLIRRSVLADGARASAEGGFR